MIFYMEIYRVNNCASVLERVFLIFLNTWECVGYEYAYISYDDLILFAIIN